MTNREDLFSFGQPGKHQVEATFLSRQAKAAYLDKVDVTLLDEDDRQYGMCINVSMNIPSKAKIGDLVQVTFSTYPEILSKTIELKILAWYEAEDDYDENFTEEPYLGTPGQLAQSKRAGNDLTYGQWKKAYQAALEECEFEFHPDIIRYYIDNKM